MPPRLTIVAVPGLRAADLTSPQCPGLRSLAASSAVGWMNCRVARTTSRRDQGEAAAWVTLGAGARAAADAGAGMLDAGSMLRVAASVKRANAYLDHQVPFGALGDLAHRAGLRTYVTGDEDAIRPNRAAWLMLADARGGVDDVADLTPVTAAHALLEPYGRATPDGALRLGGHASVSLLVFGDLARANRYAPLCLPQAAAAMRERALRRLDAILAGLVVASGPTAGRSKQRPYVGGGATDEASLIVLAPDAGEGADSADRLAPILIRDRGLAPGLLTSGSTRTPGLIANTDVVPTIAAVLHVPAPAGLVGRAARSTGGAMSADAWRGLHDRWLACARLQSVIGGLPTVQGVLVLVAVVGWWRRQARWERVARCCAGIVLSLPVVGIAVPAFGITSMTGSIVALVVVCAIAGGACLRSTLGSHTVLATMTAAGIVTCGAALLWRTEWFAFAWPSYSLMEGARYYGIGNEYAAALGTYLLIALAFASRARARVHLATAWAVALVGLACAAAFGHPGYGANAGGAAGIALAAVVLGVALRRDRVRARDVALAALAVVAVTGLALLADVFRSSGEQSHIARALTASDGPLGIALRKVQMNLWLLAHSPWTLLLASGLTGMAVLGWHGKRERDPRAWWAARAAIFWLAVGLFALNDSGVVAGAECLGIGMSALGLWAAVPRLDTERPVSVN